MLHALSIRDIVLIDKVELAFEPGLCVLTGETGAGKSILLDALGLATGARAERRLVRHGADEGAVTAIFAVTADHLVHALLDTAGVSGDPDAVLLRRMLSTDGRSRAFINDQPVSVALLQDVGASLLEIHGQHDDRGLLDPGAHRALLDQFGGLGPRVAAVRTAHGAWRDAAQRFAKRQAALTKAQTERDYLAHVAQELEALDPQADEEETLAAERTALMHGEKIAGDLEDAVKALGEGGLTAKLSAALRRLERAREQAAGRLDEAVAAIDRALTEVAEAQSRLETAQTDCAFDPDRLAAAEERLFALRAAARKHDVRVDDLPGLRDRFRADLDAIETGAADLAKLEEARDKAHTAYLDKAQALSKARTQAAKRLDAAVMAELAPLKLDKAHFRTGIETLDGDKGGADGLDRVRFEVATNPGAPFGPLTQIASGGELSRFILALKVVLAGGANGLTLIFDEIDRGVGGAVADAVGERLARLAGAPDTQVLVVTHSPQVAARGKHHWRIAKEGDGSATVTRVAQLDPAERTEEIARMLAGAEVTDEARAAAARLLGTDGPASAKRKARA